MKRTIITILLCLFVTGCTTFSVKSGNVEVKGTSWLTDFDHVEGIFTNGESFTIDGAKTQAEAMAEIFKAGLQAGMAVTP